MPGRVRSPSSRATCDSTQIPQIDHGLARAAARMIAVVSSALEREGIRLMSFEVDRPPDAGIGWPRPVRGDVIRGDVDEPFRQSMAELSRQLAARVAKGAPPTDPQNGVEPPP